MYPFPRGTELSAAADVVPIRANRPPAANSTDSVSSRPIVFATSGTRPSPPGFGRHSSPRFGGSAMQRQPEPSDGRTPRIPDAGRQQQSKRGKTRFRDDRSRKQQHHHHHHGANLSRHNVKKYDQPPGRSDRDPYSLRKESPVKQYPTKADKARQAKNADALKQIAEIEAAIPAEPLRINVCPAPEVVDVSVQTRQTDTEMKSLDESMIAEESVIQHEQSSVAGRSEERDCDVDVEGLYSTLREYLQVEAKFQPRLYLPVKPQRGEIAAGTRDGAVHVLRYLKVWYDLPTDVLFHAINLLDRFLTKMKVRLCHISCISVSCMHIAITSHQPQLPPINPEDLVSISQCKCTAGDVRRMSSVVEEKLGAVGETISPLHWLRLLMKLLRWACLNILDVPLQFFDGLLEESEMINKLEILSCDASCCNIRACELALVLLCTQLDSDLTIMQSSAVRNNDDIQKVVKIVGFAMELQRLCQIGDESFYASHQAVVCILDRYNTRQKTPHRQCLVWKLSSRTLKVLRPTDKLTSTLPTILEQQYSAGNGQQSHVTARLRCNSESSDDMSEDTKDWPTSPVVPILCNNN